MSGRSALRAVLVDLSGTLHIEDTAIAGAQEALSRWAPAVKRTTRGTSTLNTFTSGHSTLRVVNTFTMGHSTLRVVNTFTRGTQP